MPVGKTFSSNLPPNNTFFRAQGGEDVTPRTSTTGIRRWTVNLIWFGFGLFIGLGLVCLVGCLVLFGWLVLFRFLVCLYRLPPFK